MTNKYLRDYGIVFLAAAGAAALQPYPEYRNDAFITVAAIAGSAMYISSYLAEIRDAIRNKDKSPSELEDKVSKK